MGLKAIIKIDGSKLDQDGNPEIDWYMWTENHDPPPTIAPPEPDEPKDTEPPKPGPKPS